MRMVVGTNFKCLVNAESAAAMKSQTTFWEMISQRKRRIPKHCLGIHDSGIRPGNTPFVPQGIGTESTLTQSADSEYFLITNYYITAAADPDMTANLGSAVFKN
jgi:hypothetical protein